MGGAGSNEKCRPGPAIGVGPGRAVPHSATQQAHADSPGKPLGARNGVRAPSGSTAALSPPRVDPRSWREGVEERPVSFDMSPVPPDTGIANHLPHAPDAEQPISYFFCRSRIAPTIALSWSALRALARAACFGFVWTTLMMSSSDFFFTASDTRLGAFRAGLPAPSGPWHTAHFALNRAAPSSAHDRLGIRMNKATAIVKTSIAIFVIFMSSSSQT